MSNEQTSIIRYLTPYKAFYGYGDKYFDVTIIFNNEFTRNNNIYISKGTSFNRYFGDPFPNQSKELKIYDNNNPSVGPIYVFGENDCVFNAIDIKEIKKISSDLQETVNKVQHSASKFSHRETECEVSHRETEVTQNSNEVPQIVTAKYGLLDRWWNVIQQVKALFLQPNGDLIIAQNTNFNILFGDVYPDLPKELIIEMNNGRTHIIGETEPTTQTLIIKYSGPLLSSSQNESRRDGPAHNFHMISQFKSMSGSFSSTETVKTPPNPVRLIIDGFMIGNELELLKIRLKYLDPVVNYFVIAESERTHQNQPKQLILPTLLANPPAWLNVNKIVSVVLTAEEIDNRALARERITEHQGRKMAWGIENQQRECLSRGLEKLFESGKINDLDLIMISDLDEIPDRELLKYIRKSYCQRVLLRNFFHNYSFKWQKKDYWYSTIIFQYWDLRKNIIENLTHLRDFRYGYSRVRYIGGWHCSYFGGPKIVAEKLNNIVEGLAYYQECQKFSANVSDDIMIKMCTGVDLYGRDSEQLISNSDWTRLPQFAFELEPELLNYLIDLRNYRRILIYDAVAQKGHVFKDIRESLLESLSKRGHTVELVDSLCVSRDRSEASADCALSSEASESIDSADLPDLYLILGLHTLTTEQLPMHFIAFQLEQLPHSSLVNESYLNNLKRATRIWDYSQTNILWLLAKGIKAVYCPVGYSPCLEFDHKLISNSNKTNKVVFYGSLNSRRQQMIEILRMNNLPIEVYKNNCWGQNRKQLISEAVMVVNWHYFENGLMELSRLAPLLSNRILVISEKAKEPEINLLLKDAMVLVDNLEELITKVKYYLDHPAEAQQIADKGYLIFKDKFDMLKKLPIIHQQMAFQQKTSQQMAFQQTPDSKAINSVATSLATKLGNKKKLIIAFQSNQLSERGTEVALYDYAHYNEKILGNKSIIITQRTHQFHNQATIEIFQKRFSVFCYDQWNEVDKILATQQVDAIYMIKSGINDGQISKIVKNLVHCVFSADSPHGEIYVPISPYVKGYRHPDPWVPHMIDLPENSSNLRQILGIPAEAIVFGRHGGASTFNIKYVHTVIEELAKNKPAIYFVFLNTIKFTTTEYPNIIFLPKTNNRHYIVKFINTCDAMIHARADGETFGLSVAEFSTLNKPVITTNVGDLAHIHFLGDKKFLYQNDNELRQILESFDPKKVSHRDWNAYREFQPNKVMKQFEKVFLGTNYENTGHSSNSSDSESSSDSRNSENSINTNQWQKTYVINLDRRSDRLAKFQQRFPELINHFTRISATDGRRLAELIIENPELAERVRYNKNIGQNPYVVGCAFSHWNVWNMISQDLSLKEQDLVLIFEDDVEKNQKVQTNFISELNQCLKNITAYGAIDFLYIGGRPDKDFMPVKTINDWKPVGNKLFIRPDDRRNPYEFDRGAYAYIITKAGAKKLIADSLDLFCLPVDHWIIIKFKKHQMKILELFPHLCTSPIEYDTDIIKRDNRTLLNSFLKPTVNIAYCDLWLETEGTPLTVEDMNNPNYYKKIQTSRNFLPIDKGIGLTYFQYLKELLKDTYTLSLTTDIKTADLVIASIFSNNKKQMNPSAKLIILDYEPPRLNSSANLCVNSSTYTLSSRKTTERIDRLDMEKGTDKVIGIELTSKGTDVYLPLFIHHWGFNIINKLLAKPQNSSVSSKTKFCLCIIKNQTCQFRNDYVKQLMNYKLIDCYGKLFKNISNPIIETSSWTDPRIEEIIKDYKFMITFENCSAGEYHSEKIVMAMKSGTIPIYWGDPEINQIFNTNSFINVTKLGVLNSIEKIKELDQNDEAYMQMYREPWLSDQSLLKSCSEAHYKNQLIKIISTDNSK